MLGHITGFLSIVVLVAMIGTASGDTYIVDDDLGNWASFDNIEDALVEAESGDIIRVYEGVYYENPVPTTSVKIIGNSSDVCIVDGGGEGSVFELNTVNIEFRSLTIRNSGTEESTDSGINAKNSILTMYDCVITDTRMGLRLDSTHDSSFRNCTVKDSWYGFFSTSSSRNTLRECLFRNFTQGTVIIRDGCTDNFVIDCEITEGSDGIFLGENQGRNVIQDCWIHNNSRYGITMYKSPNNRVIGCEINNNSKYGVVFGTNSNNEYFEDLDIHHNGWDGVSFFVRMNTTFVDCDIYSNDRDGVGGADNNGVRFKGCRIFDNGEYGMWQRDSSNINLTNCSLFNNSDGDMKLEDTWYVDMLNSTAGWVTADASSYRRYYNFLHCQVKDPFEVPIEGVDLKVTNDGDNLYRTEGFGGSDDQTGSDGMVRWMIVHYRTYKGTLVLEETETEAFVEYQDKGGNRTVNMSTSHVETFYLENVTLPPTTWIVDDDGGRWADFETINEAVNGSQNGDAIMVYDGVYTGRLDIFNSVRIYGNGSLTTDVIGPSDGPIVNISKSNTTFDGFRISRVNSIDNDDGIEVANANSSLVANISIHDVDTGCRISSSSFVTLRNITVEEVGAQGIVVMGGSGNSFERLTCGDIHLKDGCTDSVIIDCDIKGGSGIKISSDRDKGLNSDRNLVVNTTISDCTKGISITSDRNTVLSCSITDSMEIGVDIGRSKRNSITSAYISGFTFAGIVTDTLSMHTSIIDTTIMDSTYAVFEAGMYTSIDSCIIDNCSRFSVYSYASLDGNLNDTYVNGSEIGVKGYHPKGLSIFNCTFTNQSDSSIDLEGAEECTVFDSSICAGNASAILLTSSEDCVIYGNTIWTHEDSEMVIANDTDGSNQWDNGSWGNYWSDAELNDDDGNGIGDEAVTVVGNSGSTDRYPLTRPPCYTCFSGSHGPPVARINSIGPSPIYAGEIVVLNGTGIDPRRSITRYVWSSSVEGVKSNGSTGISYISFSTTGNHTISLIVMNDIGWWSSPDHTAIRVLRVVKPNQAPNATIVSITPNETREWKNVTFSALGEDPDGTIAKYIWNSSIDGMIYSGPDHEITLSNLSLGNHTIELCVMDNSSAWSLLVNGELKVTEVPPVLNKIPIILSASIDPVQGEEGSPIHFYASAEDADGEVVRYVWTSSIDHEFLNVTTENATTKLSTGIHTISVIVYDNNGSASNLTNLGQYIVSSPPEPKPEPKFVNLTAVAGSGWADLAWTIFGFENITFDAIKIWRLDNRSTLTWNLSASNRTYNDTMLQSGTYAYTVILMNGTTTVGYSDPAVVNVDRPMIPQGPPDLRPGDSPGDPDYTWVIVLSIVIGLMILILAVFLIRS